MLFKVRNVFTGQMNEMELPLSFQEYELATSHWKNGALIQDAFPTLTLTQREFVKFGMSEYEQDKMYGEPDAI